MEKVIVTGATGFIGLHCIHQLLQKGYSVNATLRSESRKDEVKRALTDNNVSIENLELYVADLENDGGWDEAVSGCKYMLHVASPLALGKQPEEYFVKPAVAGAKRALEFAAKHGVEKVVLTSSFAAIVDTPDEKEVFNEDDWSDPDKVGITFYNKSKTLAEKFAWDFVKNNPNAPRLTVINPVLVTGPTLSKDIGVSNSMVDRLASGKLPMVTKVHIGFVDVRDVAFAHIAALTNVESDNERILVSEKVLWMDEVSKILRNAGFNKAPKLIMPKWFMQILGLFRNDLVMVLPMIGKRRDINSTKAKDILKWNPISAEESIVETANQMKEFGLIK
jgi:dihydroflavonol-4-reductase